MADEKIDVKKADDTASQEASLDKKIDSTDGKTPDITQQFEEMKQRVEKAEERASRADMKASNMEKAMKEEREKRKAALQENEKKDVDVLKQFDAEEIENFNKVGKGLGFVTKEDLAKEQTQKQQATLAEDNQSHWSHFLEENKNLFGSADSATDEQNKNWSTFTSFFGEVFDITSPNAILSAKSLDKKLSYAIEKLKGVGKDSEIKKKAKDEAYIEKQDADMLSMGSRGSSSTKTEETWPYKTPKKEMVQRLQTAGYSDDRIKEMLETAQKKGISKKF